MYDTTLESGAGWGETTVDCGINTNGNVGVGVCGVSGVSTACGAVMARLRSVAVYLLHFVYSPQMIEREQ